jgi:hypothetical protein
MIITADVVRDLLGSSVTEPTLVILEGSARVVPAEALENGEYAGSIVVAGREDVRRLAENVDLDSPSGTEVRELAERLDSAASELGG